MDEAAAFLKVWADSLIGAWLAVTIFGDRGVLDHIQNCKVRRADAWGVLTNEKFEYRNPTPPKVR